MPAKHITEDDPLICPKCAKPMESGSAGEINFHRCTGCAGLWLKTTAMELLMARRDLAKVIDTGSTAVGEWTDAVEGVLIRPRDRGRLIRMVNHRQPHVQYESCKTCGGVFLDAGELRDLASFTLIERLKGLFRRAK